MSRLHTNHNHVPMSYRACLLLVCSYWPLRALSGPQPALVGTRRDSITVDTTAGQTTIRVLQPGLRRYTHAVRFRHQGMVILCDDAIHQLASNRVIAHGNVRLTCGDSISIRSDSILYDAANRRATLLGRALLQHHRLELAAPRLHYNLLTGVVYYAGNSHLADGPNVLTSHKGRYNAHTRQLMAYQAVALKTPYTTLRADSLWYTPTDTPIPTVDFGKPIYIDESELTRHLPATKHPARAPRKALAKKPWLPPAAVRSASRPGRSSGPAPNAADRESDLERLLNRPQ